MERQIPRGPQDLTAEWLTYALREKGTISQVNVKSFEATTLGGEQGITGNLARLALLYDTDEESAPRSLIAKFATEHEAQCIGNLGAKLPHFPISFPTRLPAGKFARVDPVVRINLGSQREHIFPGSSFRGHH